MSVQRKTTRSNSREESTDLPVSAIYDKLDLLLKEMQDFRLESKEMAKSIEFTHEKIDDLTKLVKQHDKDIMDCKHGVEELKQDKVFLNRRVDDLRSEVVSWQQYSRANCVDIEGVPMGKEENIMDVVRAVARAVRFELKPEMIDAVHRLGRRGLTPSKPPGIIIKFVRRLDKDELMRLAKIKPGFAASDAGFVSENKIYIRHSMSPETRALFLWAKDIGRHHGYKFVWFSNGRILMRKVEGSSVIHVTSRSQVAQLSGRKDDGHEAKDQ